MATASREVVSRTKSGRAKPGARGGGKFFHVEVRPPAQFVTFRMQDVGGKGGIERLAGQRASGSWDTQKWLIAKDQAHVEDGKLVGDTPEARKVLRSLTSEAEQVTGDRFRAKPRRDVPEKEKPTPAMRKALQRNIRKAQAAVRTRKTGVAAEGTVKRATKRAAKTASKGNGRTKTR